MYILKTITRPDGSTYNSHFRVYQQEPRWSDEQRAISNWLTKSDGSND